MTEWRNWWNRRSIRLKGYDYTQPGAYFVTLCTHERAHLFGRVVDGEMVLNELGEIARQCWLAIPEHFPQASLDEYVIMPNHVHGIIWIVHDVGAKNFSPLHAPQRAPLHSPQHPNEPPRGTSKTIGSVMRGFKIGVTKWARQNTDVYTVWQRNYYEHIIRTERALNASRQYIIDNPRRWHLDRYNPDAIGPDLQARDLWRMLKEDARTHPRGRGAAALRPYKDDRPGGVGGEATPRPYKNNQSDGPEDHP